MKTIHCLIAAALLCGCSKPAVVKQDVVSDAKITWFHNDHNATLDVIVGQMQTNLPVSSLDEALSKANQFGWKFISGEHDEYSESYHVQRTGHDTAYLFVIPGQAN
jgi:hypothetical protein